MIEKMKDLGRRMLGQGREVKFKDDVAEYAANHGVASGDAQKAVFLERMRDVDRSLGTRSLLESFPELFQDLEAALNETVASEGVERCLADAETPALRPLGPIVAAPRDLQTMAAFFQQRHEKRKPGYAVLKDSAESMLTMRAAMLRLQSDPRYAAAPDVESLLNDPANPDLRADMGLVLLSRKEISRHERGFANQVRFEKSKEELKENAREIPAKLLLDPVVESLKGVQAIVKGRGSFDSVAGALKKVAVSLSKGAWHGAKTLKSLIKTASALMSRREK